MLIPMERLDRAILDALEEHVLQPSIIARAIEKALQQLHTPDNDPDARRETLKKDLAKLETELARLATAIASGCSLPTLLTEAQERAHQRTRVQAELALLDGLPFMQLNAKRLEEELLSYLVDWPTLTQRHPAQMR